MNYQSLKKFSTDYYPAFLANDVFSERALNLTRVITTLIFIVSGAVSFIGILPIPYSTNFHINVAQLFLGLFYFSLAARLVVFMIDAFHASYYFRGLKLMLVEGGDIDTSRNASFEIASVIYVNDERDITKSFIFSDMGERIMMRLGVESHSLAEFLQNHLPVKASALQFPAEGQITLASYCAALIAADASFRQFLFACEIQEKQFVGAADWVERISAANRKRARWWGRDALGRVAGIGKAWSYGKTYLLEKYGHDIYFDSMFASLDSATPEYARGDVEELEIVLAREREANAVIVGEDPVASEIPIFLAKMISRGRVMPQIEHKRIFALDGNIIVSTKKTKGEFEQELIRIMNEAVRAGNIILFLKNFPAFIKSAQTIGSSVSAVLEPYLASSSIQIIATSAPMEYHNIFQSDPVLSQRFEAVKVEHTSGIGLVHAIENASMLIEARHGVFFTYQAIEKAIEGAENYFSDSAILDKAVDLLVEAVSSATQRGAREVGASEVAALIHIKTGVPTTVGFEEKEMLLHLEETLHKRIIGQEEAIFAISGAMHRMRTGVSDIKKPIGSFLFLGPTGVGKTETAKALAATFYKSSDAMLRIDMTEYCAGDSVEKLIGSFESNKPGVLAMMLREKPYGVLLLDEFEKASKEVVQLFLQVLDEGFFSDMNGKKVSAKNIIIIATSNAGSDLIWEKFQKGEMNNPQSVARVADELINEVILRGLYTPELLNRFSGIVVFKPLGPDQIRQIARLMLKSLVDRLREKGYELMVTDLIVETLVNRGYNPKLGARPMKRALQDTVEEAIAQKILRSDIKPGDKIELTEIDIAG